MTQNDSDGIPRMGDDIESILRQFTCTCGQPRTPGVTHYYDGRPCAIMDNSPNPQTGAQADKLFGNEPGDNVVRPEDAWKLRLIAEHADLDKKGMALTKFLRGETEVPKGAAYADLPPRDQFLLGKQAQVMGEYFAVLTERIWRAENPALRDEADAQAAAKEAQGRMPMGDNDNVRESVQGVGSGGTDGNM